MHFQPSGAQTAIYLDFCEVFRQVFREVLSQVNKAWELPTPYGRITLVRSHTGELRPRELRPRAVTLFRGSPFPWFPLECFLDTLEKSKKDDFFPGNFHLVENSLSPRKGEFQWGASKGGASKEMQRGKERKSRSPGRKIAFVHGKQRKTVRFHVSKA